MTSRTAGVEQRVAARRQASRLARGETPGNVPAALAGSDPAGFSGRPIRCLALRGCVRGCEGARSGVGSTSTSTSTSRLPVITVHLPVRNLSRSLSGCTTQIHGGLARAGQAGAARFTTAPSGVARPDSVVVLTRQPTRRPPRAVRRGRRDRPHCDVPGAELPHGLLIGPAMSPTSAHERRCGDSPFQRPAGLTQPAPPLGCRLGRRLHPDLGLVLGQDPAAGRRLQDVQALPRSSDVEAGAQFGRPCWYPPAGSARTVKSSAVCRRRHGRPSPAASEWPR
jgi:hypothetical protein